MVKSAIFTREEVERHNTRDNLWITDGQKVYDVTKFLKRHPGGPEHLLNHAGEDVSDWMGSKGPHVHSKAAYNILAGYCVGELKTEGADRNGVASEALCNNNNSNGNNSNSSVHNSEEDPTQMIDMKKPMVWQVYKLGKHYQDWIHTPQDIDLRFFESDILEYLTLCQWYMVPMVWVPIISAFLYFSIQNFLNVGTETVMPLIFGGFNVSIWHVPVIFVLGILMWTFMEYVIHRWVFHLKPPHWSKVLITLHFLFHGQHHKNPMNKDRLVFPPVPASFFAFIIWYAYDALLPHATSQCIVAGTALGYVFYDLMHYYLHHGTPKGAYLKDLKNYHINHHYVEQNKGFGISSKLWDHPFDTLITKSNVKMIKSS